MGDERYGPVDYGGIARIDGQSGVARVDGQSGVARIDGRAGGVCTSVYLLVCVSYIQMKKNQK